MEGWQTQVVTASATESLTRWQLSVVLPAYNERLAIQQVLGELVEALSDEPIQYEIVVVDDASTDGTADLAEQFARGEFLPLRRWLGEKIHRQGQRYSAAELVEQVTGRPLSPEPLIEHLRAKLGPLYGIG